MKPNTFLIIISVLLALLIGYFVYNTAVGKDNDILCGIGATICFIATLVPMLGLKYQSGRLGTNIRVFSVLFFIIFLISNFCFAGFGIDIPYYVITNGILLLIFLAIFYKMLNINNI